MARTFAEAPIGVKGNSRLMCVEGEDAHVEILKKHFKRINCGSRELAEDLVVGARIEHFLACQRSPHRLERRPPSLPRCLGHGSLAFKAFPKRVGNRFGATLTGRGSELARQPVGLGRSDRDRHGDPFSSRASTGQWKGSDACCRAVCDRMTSSACEYGE